MKCLEDKTYQYSKGFSFHEKNIRMGQALNEEENKR